MSDQPEEKELIKCTDAQMEDRVEKVLSLLMMGRPRSYVVRYAAKEWGIASRTVDKLLAKAKEELKEINKGTREENIEQIMANFWYIYRRAMEKHEYNLALSVLKEVAKVKGLNEVLVTHTIEDKRDIIDVSDQDLEKSLESQVYSNDNH